MNATTGMNLGTDSVSSAANRAHQMVDTAADRAAPAIQSAATTAHQTIDKMANAGTSATQWAASSGKQLVNNGTALADAAGGYVRARPLMSVAGAAAIGYFIGRMLR